MTDTDLMTVETDPGLPVLPQATEISPSEKVERIEEHTLWPVLFRLPVVLTVRIPLSAFKVRDLLQLQQGQLIRSDWSTTEDIPVKIGRVQLAWSEFEVVDECMAMRLTRLA